MSRRGLFSLSADPIHKGHLSVIRSCAHQTEELLVYVTDNDEKVGSYLFDLDERFMMTKRAIAASMGYGNIRVIKGRDLLMDVFLREGCDMLFRGVRGQDDARYEMAQLQCHAMLVPDLFGDDAARRNKFRLTSPMDASLGWISSSAVKGMAAKYIDVSDMVPAFVQEALQVKMHRQYLIGITGQMGSGKTHLAEFIVKQVRGQGLPAQTINLDEMIRRLYSEQSSGAQLVRERLVELLGDDVVDGRAVDREALKRAVAKAEQGTLEQLHELTSPHVYRLLREELRGRKGLILLEWAQLAENELGYLTNNNAIVVECPDREEFLAGRGLQPEVRRRFEGVQWPADEKYEKLAFEAERARHGYVVKVVNRKGREFDAYREVAKGCPGWFGRVS